MKYMNIKDLIVETLTDNKKLIVGLYALFIIVFIATWIIMSPKMAAATGNITALSTPGEGTGALELFIHNELSGIVTYFGSIFFGIIAIVMVVYNAINIAMIGPLFASIMHNGGIFYIFYLIPHGIFEFTGMIFDSTSGILLFLFIWRFIKALRSDDTNGASDAFEKTKKTLIQSIVIFVLAMIMTLIAAPIEAYVSIPLAEFVMGFFGLM